MPINFLPLFKARKSTEKGEIRAKTLKYKEKRFNTQEIPLYQTYSFNMEHLAGIEPV